MRVPSASRYRRSSRGLRGRPRMTPAMSATYAAWLSALRRNRRRSSSYWRASLAALIQLRHIRAGNQLQALLSLERDFRSARAASRADRTFKNSSAAAIGRSGLPARARDDRIRRSGSSSGDDRLQLAQRDGNARQAWARFRRYVYGSFRALDRPLLAAGRAGHCRSCGASAAKPSITTSNIWRFGPRHG